MWSKKQDKNGEKIFFEQFVAFLFGGLKKRLYLCIAFSENGRLAQLVQSICLTSRGSAVRIRQRPQRQKAVFNTKAAVFIFLGTITLLAHFLVYDGEY